MTFRPLVRTVALASLLPLLLACPKAKTDPPGATPAKPPAAAPVAPLVRDVEGAMTRFATQGRPMETPDITVHAAVLKMKARDFAGVEALLKPLVEGPQAGAQHRYLYALSLHKQKRYAEARPLFEKLMADGPRFEREYSIFLYYAWCLFYLGELDGARASFAAYEVFDATDPDTWFGRGLCDLEQSKLESAQANFEKALAVADAELEKAEDKQAVLARLKPDVAKAHARLGDVFAQRASADAAHENELLEKARDHLEFCVKLNPGAYEAWFTLSRVYTRLGQPKLAEDALHMHEQMKAQRGAAGKDDG